MATGMTKNRHNVIMEGNPEMTWSTESSYQLTSYMKS